MTPRDWSQFENLVFKTNPELLYKKLSSNKQGIRKNKRGKFIGIRNQSKDRPAKCIDYMFNDLDQPEITDIGNYICDSFEVLINHTCTYL